MLNECAQKFVKSLIQKSNPEFNETINKVKAGRQWNNIDVWAKVNEKYLVIIEDKTYTKQHSGQLNTYKKYAKKWCSEQNPKYQQPICIYLKTGNESKQSLKEVNDNGFAVFNRLNSGIGWYNRREE